MFDGALSPWHVAIVVLFVFLVFGPKRIANKVHTMRDAATRLTGEEPAPSDRSSSGVAGSEPEPRGWAYRLGRWISRRIGTRRSPR
jgi:hypothetical protein